MTNMIFKIMVDNPTITRDDLAKKSNINTRTAGRYIEKPERAAELNILIQIKMDSGK